MTFVTRDVNLLPAWKVRVNVASHERDLCIFVAPDGRCTFHPDCVAYPDDESAYTGELDLRGMGTLNWTRGGGLIIFTTGEMVSLGDAVYEAVQRGIVRVGVR